MPRKKQQPPKYPCKSPGCTEGFDSRIGIGLHNLTCRLRIPGIRKMKRRNERPVSMPRKRARAGPHTEAVREEPEVSPMPDH